MRTPAPPSALPGPIGPDSLLEGCWHPSRPTSADVAFRALANAPESFAQKQTEVELFVGLGHVDAAVAAACDCLDDTDVVPLTHEPSVSLIVRFVGPDDSWLSPAAPVGDAASTAGFAALTLVVRGGVAVGPDPVFFETVAKGFVQAVQRASGESARAHWGKRIPGFILSNSPTYWPGNGRDPNKWRHSKHFRQIINQFDPHGLFSTEHTRALFR